MEKSFKRELAAELPNILVDQLNKIYRKRPKGKGIGLGAGSPDFPPATDVDGSGTGSGAVVSLDPYYPRRPTTAMKMERNVQLLEEALSELDSPENMPENCPPDIWQRMCQIRRTKIDSEQVLKGKGMIVAIQSFYYSAFIHCLFFSSFLPSLLLGWQQSHFFEKKNQF